MLKVIRYIGKLETKSLEVKDFSDCEDFIDETKILAKDTPSVVHGVFLNISENGYGESVLLWTSHSGQYMCPSCKILVTNHNGRTCPDCNYTGDWIQPGYTETYAQRKKRIDSLLR